MADPAPPPAPRRSAPAADAGGSAAAGADDWGALLAWLGRQRAGIAAGAVVGLLLGLVVLHLIPAGGGAAMLIAPAGAPPRMAVAAPAGEPTLAVPSVADDREAAFGRYLALLTAPEVAAELLAQPAIADTLYAGYRRTAGGLRPASAGAWVEAGWRGLIGLPRLSGAVPTEAAGRLARRLAVLPSADPRHRRLVLAPVGRTTADSEAAIALLAAADRAADALTRRAALAALDEREVHLQATLGDGNRLAARQAAATAMLEEIERERLRIEAGSRYAAMRVSGPAAPAAPVRPRGGLVLAAAVAAGALAGALLGLLRRRPG